jgi:Mrp family chromosome partitioning ATPase
LGFLSKYTQKKVQIIFYINAPSLVHKIVINYFFHKTTKKRTIVIILSAFNKGGVGKTTLAVHVAGLLAEQGRVLLVDCVDQYDAFYFYCHQEPKNVLIP